MPLSLMNQCSIAILIISLASLTSTVSRAQVIRELYADSASPLGNSVAVNAKYVVGGRPLLESSRGDVVVFDVVTGKLLRKVTAPTGDRSAGDLFGQSVALRGEELIVGAPVETNGALPGSGGAVYVINLRTGAMVTKIQALSGHTGFGHAVAVEGNVIVVGAPTTLLVGPDRGVAALVTHRPGAATSTGLQINPPLAENGSKFGSSVAIYGDEVLVGHPLKDEPGAADAGNVHRYSTAGSFTRTYKAGTLVAGAKFGNAVALNGATIIVGDDPPSGSNSSHFFAYDGTSKGTAGAGLGYSVATSGRAIVMGGPNIGSVVPGQGLAAMMLESTGGRLFDSYISPSAGLRGFDGVGTSVAVWGDTIVAGAPGRSVQIVGGGDVVQGCIIVSRSAPRRVSESIVGEGFRYRMRTGSPAPGLPDTTVGALRAVVLGSWFGENALSVVADINGKSTNGLVEKMWAWEARDLASHLRSRMFTDIDQVADVSEVISNVPEYWCASIVGKTRPVGKKLYLVEYDTSPVIRSIEAQGNGAVTGGNLKSFGRVHQGTQSGAAAYAIPLTFVTGVAGAVSASNDSGLRVGTTSNVLREGAGVPGEPASVVWAQFGSWVSMEAQYAAFAPFIVPSAGAAPKQYLVKHDVETVTTTIVVDSGSIAPGFSGIRFSSFLGAMTNGYSTADGETAFRGALQLGIGITAANNEGIWVESGDINLRIRKGRELTGLDPSLIVKRILNYWIETEDGNLRALVQFSGVGVNSGNDVALVNVNSSGTATIVLREGDFAPGCASARISTLNAVDGKLNKSYAILATLKIAPGVATAADNLVLYASASTASGSGTHPILMLRKGSSYKAASSPASVVKSFAFTKGVADVTGACATGQVHALGCEPTTPASPVHLALILTFTDNKQAAAAINAP